MKKNIISIMLALVCFLSHHNFLAGQVNVQLIPPPFGQLFTEDVFNLTVSNTGTQTYAVQLHATIAEASDGLILDAYTSTIMVPPGLKPVDYHEIQPVEFDHTDDKYKQIVTKTGSVPAGEYIICVYAIHAETEEVLGEGCIEHFVAHPAPPEIIFPGDGAVVENKYPVFSWSPPAPVVAEGITYTIRISQVQGDQTLAEAIESTPYWFVYEGITGNQFQYPVGAREPEPGKTYCWSVQALYPSGEAIGENNGMSEIAAFQYIGFQDGEMMPIEIFSPEKNTLVTTKNPVFEWSDLQIDGLTYSLTFFEMTPDLFRPENREQSVDMPETDMTITEQNSFQTFQAQEFHTETGEIFFSAKDIADNTFVYPEDAPAFNAGFRYAFIVEGWRNNRKIAQSEKRAFSFVDETLGPCDTVVVEATIKMKLEELENDMCTINQGLLDSLELKLDDYQNLKWQEDSLKGLRDATSELKNLAKETKNGALSVIRDELDATNNMTSDDQNCAPGWESQFKSRYQPSRSRRRNARFKRVVKSSKDAFSRCMDRNKNSLEDRKKDIEDDWERPLTELNTKIQNLDNEITQKSNQAAADKAKIQALIGDLIQNYCSANQKWDWLITYTQGNYECLKCGKLHVTVPDNIARMDSCLNDFLEQLARLKNKILAVPDFKNLSANANNYFNMNKFREDLDSITSLRNEFKQLGTKYPNVKLIHPCCERFNELASGFYIYTRPRKVVDDQVGHGTNFGTGYQGYMVVPGDPLSYGTDDDYHDEAVKQKTAIKSDLYKLAGKTDKLIRNMEYSKTRKDGKDRKVSAEYAFRDPKVLQLHGMANAVKYHQNTENELDDILNSLISGLSCFDQNNLNHNRRQIVEQYHKCFDFKKCIEALDRIYSDYRESLAKGIADLLEKKLALEEKKRLLDFHLSSLANRQKELQKRISDISTEINNVGANAESSQREAVEAVKQQLRSELQGLESNLPGIQEEINDFSGKINEVNQKLDKLNSDIEKANNIDPPGALANIDDCEEVTKDIEQQNQQWNEENEEMNREAAEATEQAEEAEDDFEDTYNKQKDVNDDISELEERIAGHQQEIQDEAERIRKRERYERKSTCVKLLADYFDKNKSEDDVMGDLGDLFENIHESADNIAGGATFEQIDKFNALLDRIQEMKDKIETINTLLKGIFNDNLQDRSEAFEEILKISGEIGSRIPGIGEMIGFYAEAYAASIEAIDAIQDEMLQDYKEEIKKYIPRMPCRVDSWKDKTLDDILNDAWNSFKFDNSTILNRFKDNDDSMKKLEAHFKKMAAARVLSCCLEQLSVNE